MGLTVDLSLYKNESQIEKKVSPVKRKSVSGTTSPGRSTGSNAKKLRRSAASSASKSKKTLRTGGGGAKRTAPDSADDAASEDDDDKDYRPSKKGGSSVTASAEGSRRRGVEPRRLENSVKYFFLLKSIVMHAFSIIYCCF